VPFVACTIVVNAPARDVYELAKDQERFPEFMPDVELVVVLERAGSRTVSRWKTLVEDAPIEWIEEDLFDDVALRVDYKLLEGDLETFEGAWTFVERDGVTQVDLGIAYDFGVPTLAELIGPTLHAKVRENGEMMLAALKREAERASVPVRAPSATRGSPYSDR
jgi:ribosome-associated toxin RatA of RatAB toxin-antitoxin module